MTTPGPDNDGCDLISLAAPGVRQLKPYLPGKPISELEREYGVSDIIKLASNENPLGASPRALEAMRAELAEIALYPDGGGYALKHALSTAHGLDPGQITLGNGSNDVLVLIAEAFLTPGLEAVYSQYCFAVYPIAVEAVAATSRMAAALPAGHPQGMGHDLEGMASLVGPDTRLVFIANPNNPTGNWLDHDSLHGFIAALPEHVMVVVDEAYFEYSRPLGLPDASLWLAEFPNLIVTRTFSKAYGLAGIRVGYSLSSTEVAGILNRIRQPFNVNSLALAGARAALSDRAFIERSVSVNGSGLEQLNKGLDELGVSTVPSAANFVLADMNTPAMPVSGSLLRQGIIVLPVGNYGLDRHLRITVGTADQNAALLGALANTLEEVRLQGA
jgi:histidinol-phosphate aminotransferase